MRPILPVFCPKCKGDLEVTRGEFSGRVMSRCPKRNCTVRVYYHDQHMEETPDIDKYRGGIEL